MGYWLADNFGLPQKGPELGPIADICLRGSISQKSYTLSLGFTGALYIGSQFGVEKVAAHAAVAQGVLSAGLSGTVLVDGVPVTLDGEWSPGGLILSGTAYHIGTDALCRWLSTTVGVDEKTLPEPLRRMEITSVGFQVDVTQKLGSFTCAGRFPSAGTPRSFRSVPSSARKPRTSMPRWRWTARSPRVTA